MILASCRQAAALFMTAPMIAVRMAPPAPLAITCEIIPSTLRLPDCAAAVIAGSNKITIWPSTPPPTKPEIMLPIIPRSKVGDDLPMATPPSRNDLGVDSAVLRLARTAFPDGRETLARRPSQPPRARARDGCVITVPQHRRSGQTRFEYCRRAFVRRLGQARNAPRRLQPLHRPSRPTACLDPTSPSSAVMMPVALAASARGRPGLRQGHRVGLGPSCR